MEREATRERKIMDICLLAGKIMLQSGAETYRVEDTMIRIANSGGLSAQSFVMPTGIVFSASGEHKTNLARVSERGIDLQKVTRVNTISRSFCNGELTMEETYQQLREVETSKHEYSYLTQIFMAGIVSGCFLIMFQGMWKDFIPAFLCGSMGFGCNLAFHRWTRVRFFAEFLASFALGLLAFLLVHSSLGHVEDKIIIAAVMPLVPGLLITNAVRDLMAGHLVSGMSKGIEAFLTALAIGGGIAVTLSIV